MTPNIPPIRIHTQLHSQTHGHHLTPVNMRKKLWRYTSVGLRFPSLKRAHFQNIIIPRDVTTSEARGDATIASIDVDTRCRYDSGIVLHLIMLTLTLDRTISLPVPFMTYPSPESQT